MWKLWKLFVILQEHPEIKHGTIRIGFTPDEEIGRGPHKFDVDRFNADFAYTMDGSQYGELQYESFNAAGSGYYMPRCECSSWFFQQNVRNGKRNTFR